MTIRHGTVIDGTDAVAGDLVIVGERIAGREPAERSGGRSTPPNGTEIDARGLLVAPGFIDLQINGSYGLDLWSAPQELWALAQELPRHGVTAFCPTIISGPPDRADAAIDALAKRPTAASGAEPLGLHLEGPMLAPARRGAHAPEHLVAPTPDVIAGWSAARGVAMVTLAPELPGALDVVAELRRAGVVVAAGHSDATADEAARAARAGVTCVTHLFNAMAPLHHRRPGLVGHALGSGQLAAGLIVDGIHVDPSIVALTWRALGPDRLVLVSDAVAAAGLEPGMHRFGTRTITAGPDGVRHPDGTLAGSDLTLDRAVRNLIEMTGCSPAQAIGCATTTPARVLGRADDRGHLSPGALADVTLLDDDLRVVATICRGRISYLAPQATTRVRLRGQSPDH